MKSLMLVLAGSLALAPLAVAQDHAVPRGGGGGGSSSGGGGGHPGVSSSSGGSSGGSSSGGSSSGYSGGSSSSSGSGSSSTAERRHPRAGTGRGGYAGGGGYYGGGYYGGGYYPGYDGWYYPGWYGSYWWPYGAYGWYGGYWGSPGGWGGWGRGGTTYHYVQRETGSVRVLVDPSEARVYVDGYYAGVVDDYDGLFQRLNVSPGRHEIMLKLEGYKTHRMKVYVAPESTLKLHYDMQKGSGESFEDLAGNVPERELRRERDRDLDRDDERWNERERRDRSDDAVGGGGRLRLSVRPADASVYVDGAFRGSGREATALQLPPGRHRVEVVRPGFRTVEREVEITAGDTADLTVELEKGSI